VPWVIQTEKGSNASTFLRKGDLSESNLCKGKRLGNQKEKASISRAAWRKEMTEKSVSCREGGGGRKLVYTYKKFRGLKRLEEKGYEDREEKTRRKKS